MIGIIFLSILLLTSCHAWKISNFGKCAAAACSVSLAFASSQICHAADASVAEVKVSYKKELVPMKSLLGKQATLVVNFGGQCDLPADGDPQCKGLVDLYQKYKAKGFNMVFFPTEQFRDRR